MRIRHFLALGLVAASLAQHAGAQQSDDVLFKYTSWLIVDGKTGPIAAFQKRLNDALANCQLNDRVTPDGKFGRPTRDAIQKLAKCKQVSDRLSPGSAAFDGAITTGLWSVVVPDSPAPAAAERAGSLKLTFEATDYDHLEWNFCQNKPFYAPAEGREICFTNDSRSYMTWGPNGATAGHGREIQTILAGFLSDPANERVFDTSFGNEASAVRRMIALPDLANNSDLEIYLCSVWNDAARRAAWRSGFAALGKQDQIQQRYKTTYKSSSFDGGKVATFYRVWQEPEFALRVSELDHAFFVDRSAHMRISADALRTALRNLKAGSNNKWPLPAAEIRRHIATVVIPSNQRKDRLGRDVAYFVDHLGADRLTEEERAAWKNRGSRRAADVGLSDERFVPQFVPGAAIAAPAQTGSLSAEERSTCPAAVLNPSSPK